jgi:putative acetyltransferase
MTLAQSNIPIRLRVSTDDAAIAAVIRAAFRGPDEAALVARLRKHGDMVAEFVALDDANTVIGHIAFSRLEVQSGSETRRAVALAPLAVAPGRQRQGIGGALILHAHTCLRDEGEELVVVLGHPAYYPQFGFSSLLARLLDAPYAGEAFMALELKPGILAALRWSVAYPRAFAEAH